MTDGQDGLSALSISGARAIKDKIVDLLDDGDWRTVAEIAEKGKGGIGSRRTVVADCLRASPEFVAEGGHEHGRSPQATLWQLRATVSPRAASDGHNGPEPSPHVAGHGARAGNSSQPGFTATSGRDAPAASKEEIVFALHVPAGQIPRRFRIDFER